MHNAVNKGCNTNSTPKLTVFPQALSLKRVLRILVITHIGSEATAEVIYNGNPNNATRVFHNTVPTILSFANDHVEMPFFLRFFINLLTFSKKSAALSGSFSL